MSSDNSKFFRSVVLQWLCVLVLAGACSREQASAAAETTNGVPPAGDPSDRIKNICDEIAKGDFDAAGELLKNVTTSKDDRFASLSSIVSRYEELQQKRELAKQKAYQEHFSEVEKLRDVGVPSDVNDIDEAFVEVVQAYNYGTDEQKEKLLQSDFVKKLGAKALVNGKNFEANGKWTQAYIHCYYWMKMLYKDEQKYKDGTKELTQRLAIEAALKDNSCDSSAERHEGITPGMFTRTVKALDLSYVRRVDYDEMAKKGLDQCKLLGQVLFNTKEKLAYKANYIQSQQWIAAIDAIRQEILESPLPVNRDKLNKIFSEVLALNDITIKLPTEVVVAQFAEAALETLDPYTNLVWPWQTRSFQKELTQDFSGIGVQITMERGKLKINSLLPNTPAFSSGLDAKDQIVAINGEPTKKMTLLCVVSKITGPTGTKVTLTIRHEDDAEEKTEDITITRARIIVPTTQGRQRVDAEKWLYMVDPLNNIGYIRLTGFTENTASDMDKILKKLEAKGLRGLIIDLRFNSGGYLSTAAAVADLFIEKGLIVRRQGRWGMPAYDNAHKSGTHTGYPIAILVNGQSASASEIVAGALQDEQYKLATLVGTRTYGKGSVQVVTLFPGEGSQLKLTTAYYFLPSKQPVKNRYVLEKEGRKDWGLAPDVEVEIRNDELRKMIDIQLENEILTKADHDNGSKPVERRSLKETIESDPQLAVAILVLQSKIVRAGGTIQIPPTQTLSAKAETTEDKKTETP